MVKKKLTNILDLKNWLDIKYYQQLWNRIKCIYCDGAQCLQTKVTIVNTEKLKWKLIDYSKFKST